MKGREEKNYKKQFRNGKKRYLIYMNNFKNRRNKEKRK